MNAWDRFNEWEWSGCVWLFVALFLFSQLSRACSTPTGPTATTHAIRTDLALITPYDPHEFDRATARAEMTQLYDPYDSLPPDYVFPNKAQCPNGCTTHVSGCDIKGNISFNTGEKIYHMPGQEFYSSTTINPAYDERWFCTEAEARANGFRKSSR
jgi:hypothetical protein